MSESTGGINCPECGMSFDTRDELGRHSRQQHATITERKCSQSLNRRKNTNKNRRKGKGRNSIIP
jgi:uncharacterized C2H2 Zn-finger protein